MPAPDCGQRKSRHRHIDGDQSLVCVAPELHRLTWGDTRPYPFNPWSRHKEQVKEWFLKDGLHKNIVEKFGVTTGVMQNPVTIFKAVENFVMFHGRQGLDCDFTMADQYHVFGDRFCKKGILTEKHVADIVIEAIKEGRRKLKQETGRKGNFRKVFGIGREVSSDEAEGLVKEVMLECDPEYVPRMSLVCHEPSSPPEKFIKAFKLAKREGRETSCHVEWVKDREGSEKDTPEKIRKNFQEDLPQLTKNLRTAIFDLEVNQIDHGFGLAENYELMRAVADKGIIVTVCPGSLMTTGLIDSFEMLKLDRLDDAGICVVLDADDDICMPTLNEVFQTFRDEGRTLLSEKRERINRLIPKLIENANSL